MSKEEWEGVKRELDSIVWQMSIVLYPAALALAIMIWSIALFG